MRARVRARVRVGVRARVRVSALEPQSTARKVARSRAHSVPGQG